MTPLNRPPINPPRPPHSGQLGPKVQAMPPMSLIRRRDQRKSLSIRGWDLLSGPVNMSSQLKGTIYMLAHKVTAKKIVWFAIDIH